MGLLMGKIFISYSHKDEVWVKNYLLNNLEERGLPCHIDYRDFEIGVLSIVNMERAVEMCEKTILVFTPNWIESEWGQFEGVLLQTESPMNLQKKILPLMLEKCELPKRLAIFTYANFTDKNKWDPQLDRLIIQIKNDFAKREPEKLSYPVLDDKSIQIERMPKTGYELFGRQKELKLLNKAWETGNVNVLSFVAYGGVGKSTLVNKWLEKMRWDNYRGADKVYAWSFYSQGTNERVTSADIFIRNALEWFGDSDPKQGSPWDKGKRLAKIIRETRTLLILDGLEPLQSGLDIEKGKIKDPALSMLITELAKNNNGLCIITTRVKLPELDRYIKTTTHHDLEHISDEAGRKLLELRGISGTENEFKQIVNEFGNHALAINLLGEYLHQFPGHAVNKAIEIPDLDIPEKEGKHPRRVIEVLSNRFIDKPEGELLKMLGFFDRPADIEAIKKIIEQPVIEGLTENLCNNGEASLLQAINTLRNENLLANESKHRPDTLDCHPLIREHFGEKLEQENPDAWKEAHARLYEYYKSLPKKLYGKELPDTLEEMEPLFAAVMHGCQAGKYQEVYIEIWWDRTKRREEHYSTSKLGAFGADLSCLSNFFERLWDKPSPSLTEHDKATSLGWAGFALGAVGRLSEATQPMKASLEMHITNKYWIGAAAAASNLSEQYLTLGESTSAQKYGAQSVILADRSEDEDEKVRTRATHADALHQAGKISAAEKLFTEAEHIIKKRESDTLWLYSVWGFQFCDLLLSMGKYQEVLERTKAAIKISIKHSHLLSIALDNLTIGKAYMHLGNFKESENSLNQAVDDLRESGYQDNLPQGLLARSTLYRHQKDFPKSSTDLDEAREIAEYGEMKLFLTDFHFEAARVIKAQLATGKTKKKFTIIEEGIEKDVSKKEMNKLFDEHVAKAGKLIEETGYHRRDQELAELKNSGI